MKYKAQGQQDDFFRRAAAGLVFALVLAAASCSRDTSASPTKTQITIEPGIFTVDHPEAFKLARAESHPWATELTANGSVNPDITRTIHVTSLGSGRVVDVKVRLGDSVKRGQSLVLISSPDLESANADYRKALADQDACLRAKR